MPPKSTIIDELRRAIRQSGETEYGIAKASGVPQSVLNRFMNDDRGISLETAAKLCRYFGLRLVPETQVPRKS